MQDHHGTFIVLEGSDGSGKTTQFRLLAERLKAVGHDVEIYKFPQYEQASSYFVRQYLEGQYGPADSVSPYAAAIFYALDRYEAAPHIRKSLQQGKIVLSDRYAGANMAHQGAKFASPSEQRGFFMWADSLEFQLLGIPRPSLNIFLQVPAIISKQLIDKRASASDLKLDEHEKNFEHLEQTIAAYGLLCRLFPKDFREINCLQDGQLLGIVEINDRIWETIKLLLPEPKRKGKGVVLDLGQEVKSESKRTADNKTKFDEILMLQKQMLAKAGSIKNTSHTRLIAAINLTKPLLDRRNEVQGLSKQRIVSKSSSKDEPVSLNKIIGQISESMPALPSVEALKLLQATPRNEFQILNELKSAGLNYQQKQQQLNNELKNAASKLVYTFEAVSDFDTLLAFKKEVETKGVKLLAVSLLLGHKTPEIIETASLEEPFSKAFEISDELYRKAVSNTDNEAIYNLLLGHNVRWKFDITAATLSKVLKKSKNRELIVFLGLLIEKVGEIHPHVVKMLSTEAAPQPHPSRKAHR